MEFRKQIDVFKKRMIMHNVTYSSSLSQKRLVQKAQNTTNASEVFVQNRHLFSPRPNGANRSIFDSHQNNLSSHEWNVENFCERTHSIFEEQLCDTSPLTSPMELFTEEELSKSSLEVDSETEYRLHSRQRPDLPAPSMYMMVFDANKLMTSMNQQRLRDCKNKIAHIEDKRERLRTEKIAQWQKQSDKTRAATPWSTGMAVFSWISTCLEIFTGIGMIAMGNVVGGSLLLAGGVIQLTSHIMMQTGGWEKIAELLPGDSPEEKKKLISWMQVGVAIFSMMLAGAGGMVAGTSALSPAMRTASQLATSGLLIGQGIVTIGNGISQSAIKEVHSELQKLNAAMQKLEYKQQNIREKVEEGVKFDKRCVDLIAQTLRQNSHFYSNIFKRNN